MIPKNGHSTLQYALVAVLFALSFTLQAQVAQEPTSATDSEVKIHNSRKVFLFRNGGKRVHARATERQGQSIPKQKPAIANHRSRKEARVFKRHNHFARKEGAGKNRQRNSRKRHSMARK